MSYSASNPNRRPDPGCREGTGGMRLFGLSPVGEAMYFLLCQGACNEISIGINDGSRRGTGVPGGAPPGPGTGPKGPARPGGQGGQRGGGAVESVVSASAAGAADLRHQPAGLLRVDAVAKELELVDEQVTAIAKVRDELQPMRGRGGAGRRRRARWRWRPSAWSAGMSGNDPAE